MENHEIDKLDLIAYVAGGCVEKGSEVIGAHLRSCESCRAYVDALAAEKAEFLEKFPYRETTRTAPLIMVRRAAGLTSWRVYGIAASIALMLTAGYFFQAPQYALSGRTKGETGLKVFVRNSRGEAEQRLERTYYSGERIQFVYSCAGLNKFMLLSIDTSGSITRYYPQQGDSSVVLQPGQDIPLPHSILLDDYTGKELFIGIFSEKSQGLTEVQSRIKTEFNRVKKIDSLNVPVTDAVVCKQYIAVREGAR